MKIIDRYMVRGFLGPFIWCIFLFTILAVIIDIFSFIDDIVKYKIPLSSLIAFYVYYCPTILVQAIPMAVLLSCIYSLSDLNKHSEIVAMKACGISLWRIISPILVIGFIVSMAVFLINDKIIPVSSKVSSVIRRDELEKVKQKEKQAEIIDNVAVYGSGNRIIFARRYNTKTKTLEDIIMHEHDKKENLVSKTTAEKAAWTQEGWKFNKVIVYKIDNAGHILGSPTFINEGLLPIKEKPADFANREWRAEYMSYRELKRYIRSFRGSETKMIRGLQVDLNYKIAFSFISLIIILIGAPFAMITTRGGVLIGMGMSVAIGLLYYAFIAVFIAFGKGGLLPPFVAAWLGNIVFAFLGIRLVNQRA